MNTERVEVRVTTEQRDRWDQARGLVSMAAWVKSIVDEEATRVIEGPGREAAMKRNKDRWHARRKAENLPPYTGGAVEP